MSAEPLQAIAHVLNLPASFEQAAGALIREWAVPGSTLLPAQTINRPPLPDWAEPIEPYLSRLEVEHGLPGDFRNPFLQLLQLWMTTTMFPSDIGDEVTDFSEDDITETLHDADDTWEVAIPNEPPAPPPAPPVFTGNKAKSVDPEPGMQGRGGTVKPNRPSQGGRDSKGGARDSKGNSKPPRSASRPSGNGQTRQASLTGEHPVQLPPQFEDQGLIGMGGMGEVRRVRDLELNRTVALKAIRPELMGNSRVVSRFIAEAQATGQLEHPGIVPVHQMGHMPDGRLFFTMQEVRGQELGPVIADVHHARQAAGHWDTSQNGWTFRRLLDTFSKVCEAVAYAHARGVIHRDLKPENVMVGEYGEVLVVDWGLARVMAPLGQRKHWRDRVTTVRSEDPTKATIAGRVAGTPAYMPIEQAVGDPKKQGYHSDVYALGAILYEILGGRPPYTGESPEHVLRQVLTGPPEPLPEYVPDALRHICKHAMGREPRERYATAGEMAAELGAWLEGARKHERAQSMLELARSKEAQIGRLLSRAEASRDEARSLIDHADSGAEEQYAAWNREAEADRLERGAEVLQAVVIERARAALLEDPDFVDAHSFLAESYRDLHKAAEQRGDEAAAERAKIFLQAHDKQGRHAAYLEGQASVTLVTDPPDAQVQVYRFVEKNRQFTPEPVGRALKTPLHEHLLPMGSYVFGIQAPGRSLTLWPVDLGRLDHADGVPPGSDHAVAVYLPENAEISDDELYVPGGYTWIGGDPRAPNSMPGQRVWVDAFIMRRSPVTHAEYVRFLNSKRAHGVESADINRLVPRRPGSGRAFYNVDQHGMYRLGDSRLALHPVIGVDFNAASAYASWLSLHSKQLWRLPHEVEWEKAARGVDGRAFPMGEHINAARVNILGGYPSPADIDSHPFDEGPFGMFGAAGNIRDWCGNLFSDLPDRRLVVQHPAPSRDGLAWRTVRGGSWRTPPDAARCAARHAMLERDRADDVGFRLVRTLR